MSLLPYQQQRYIPWTVNQLPITKNTVQVRKDDSIKLSPPGDSTSQNNETGQDLVLIPGPCFI